MHALTHAHPAHALLSAAHALLRPANTVAKTKITPTPTPDPIPSPSLLPIEEVSLPTEDVSDLRDVVDAINKLCFDMKTSRQRDDDDTICPAEDVCVVTQPLESLEEETLFIETHLDAEPMQIANDYQSHTHPDAELPIRQLVSPPEHFEDTRGTERGSDSLSLRSLQIVEDAPSEMYYSASSDVSLVSEMEIPDVQDDTAEEKECVIAGHVAAMRERFENMTRSNTPCPDAQRNT